MRGKPIVSVNLRKLLKMALNIDYLTNLLLAEGYSVRVLGSGCFRTALAVTKGRKTLVVKRRNPSDYGQYRFRLKGIVAAPRVFVNGWEVQHQYSRPASVQRRVLPFMRFVYDFGVHNCGLDTDGTLVAYDW